MKRNNKKFKRKSDNSLNKLSLFQKGDSMFSKKCPLSLKSSPKIDYKNISLLKNMFLIIEKLFRLKFLLSHQTNREF